MELFPPARKLRATPEADQQQIHVISNFDTMHAELDSLTDSLENLPRGMQPQVQDIIRRSVGLGRQLHEMEMILARRPAISVRQQETRGAVKAFIRGGRFLKAEISGIHAHVGRVCGEGESCGVEQVSQ